MTTPTLKPRTRTVLLSLIFIAAALLTVGIILMFVLKPPKRMLPELDDPNVLLAKITHDGRCLFADKLYATLHIPVRDGKYLQVIGDLFQSRSSNPRNMNRGFAQFIDFPLAIEAHSEARFGQVQMLWTMARELGGVTRTALLVEGVDGYVSLTLPRKNDPKEPPQGEIRLELCAGGNVKQHRENRKAHWALAKHPGVCELSVNDVQMGNLAADAGGTTMGSPIRTALDDAMRAVRKHMSQSKASDPPRVILDADEEVYVWELYRLLAALAEQGIREVDIQRSQGVGDRFQGF